MELPELHEQADGVVGPVIELLGKETKSFSACQSLHKEEIPCWHEVLYTRQTDHHSEVLVRALKEQARVDLFRQDVFQVELHF